MIIVIYYTILYYNIIYYDKREKQTISKLSAGEHPEAAHGRLLRGSEEGRVDALIRNIRSGNQTTTNYNHDTATTTTTTTTTTTASTNTNYYYHYYYTYIINDKQHGKAASMLQALAQNATTPEQVHILCVYIYIYIYIHTEREREIDR